MKMAVFPVNWWLSLCNIRYGFGFFQTSKLLVKQNNICYKTLNLLIYLRFILFQRLTKNLTENCQLLYQQTVLLKIVMYMALVLKFLLCLNTKNIDLKNPRSNLMKF